jgi:hypothetical protein
MDKKISEKKSKTQKRRSMKGGSGILTYPPNLYSPDTQLDNNFFTTRQMYNDQSVMNSRFLGGSKRNKTEKRKKRKEEKKKRGGKKGSKKEKKPW